MSNAVRALISKFNNCLVYIGFISETAVLHIKNNLVSTDNIEPHTKQRSLAQLYANLTRPEHFFKRLGIDILNQYVVSIRTCFSHSSGKHCLEDWTACNKHVLVSTDECDTALWGRELETNVSCNLILQHVTIALMQRLVVLPTRNVVMHDRLFPSSYDTDSSIMQYMTHYLGYSVYFTKQILTSLLASESSLCCMRYYLIVLQ